MPNSPSSMVNQYRLEDDEEELVDTSIKDLLITVDNPESHVTTIETYIMYRVVTKVMASGRLLLLLLMFLMQVFARSGRFRQSSWALWNSCFLKSAFSAWTSQASGPHWYQDVSYWESGLAFLSFQTTRSEFDSSEYEVLRRYQDFLWLRSRLEESYPTLIVHVCSHHHKTT